MSLPSLVNSVLSFHTIHWTLISSSETEDTCVANFEAPTSNKSRKYRLTVTESPAGSFGTYSVI